MRREWQGLLCLPAASHLAGEAAGGLPARGSLEQPLFLPPCRSVSVTKSNFGTRSGGAWDGPHSTMGPVMFQNFLKASARSRRMTEISRFSLGLQGGASPRGTSPLRGTSPQCSGGLKGAADKGQHLHGPGHPGHEPSSPLSGLEPIGSVAGRQEWPFACQSQLWQTRGISSPRPLLLGVRAVGLQGSV